MIGHNLSQTETENSNTDLMLDPATSSSLPSFSFPQNVNLQPGHGLGMIVGLIMERYLPANAEQGRGEATRNVEVSSGGGVGERS